MKLSMNGFWARMIMLPVLILIGISVMYGGWYIAKRLNYTFQYKEMVQQTVKEMVKPVCLK